MFLCPFVHAFFPLVFRPQRNCFDFAIPTDAHKASGIQYGCEGSSTCTTLTCKGGGRRGLQRVHLGTVAPDQQMEASTSFTSPAPSVKRKSSPLSSEGVNPSGMDFTETMDDLTKVLMASEESNKERLSIQCGMARLPIVENFVIDLGPALRVCRAALGIEERLESMENRTSVLEEAVSAPLPTSWSPPSPAARAQDHPLSQVPQSSQGEAPISVAALSQP